MFHSNTERLLDYWRDRRPARGAPARMSVDPRHFADLLPQAMILGRRAPGQYLFRLAGGLVLDLHQRDLRGVDFASLWSPADRPGLATGLEAARRTAEPIVLTAEARPPEGHAARLEILLAPLKSPRAPQDRMLGLIQPLEPLAVLRDRPVGEFGLLRFSGADDGALPTVRLATVNGRRLA